MLKCKEKCFKYLKYSRTEEEVRKYLEKEGFEEISIQEAIDYAKELGYIDDCDYVSMYVSDHLKINKWGPIKIKMKLQEKGIRSELTEFALADNEELIIENINELIQKKLSINKSRDYKDKQKLLNFLYNRGYDYEISKKYIERYW